MRRSALFLLVCIGSLCQVFGQHSIARKWNEALLEAIRKDFARPTVHARNLFHTSVVMYDAWAVFDPVAEPYMLGKTVHGVETPFEGFETEINKERAREIAISFAAYRLLIHRFQKSPNADITKASLDELMIELGLDVGFTSTDYSTGNAEALGNYLAESMIKYGLQDGSNEQNAYANVFYETINDPILPDFPGNPDISDPNRWQKIVLDVFIDQSGNVIVGGGPPFLSPEWGGVAPFSLTSEDLTIYERAGHEYFVYHDPGHPPYLDTIDGGLESDLYKWNFELVSTWSSHLDPGDGVMWDISPRSIGNIQEYPTDYFDYKEFYDLVEGGDPSIGHVSNPVTNKPYTEQIVPRGDYARVLAEFWADGPDSETPPGHWFTLLNHVSDQPLLVKKMQGIGPELDDLEWDIKSYFLLGGAMHDAAICAWGIKGYYDYVRPISVIRYLADKGQCTDNQEPNFNKNGIDLVPGLIELVKEDDPMVGDNAENLHKVKVRAWKGPDYVDDPFRDVAGVDWILAENWWPYQRPSFVTPPFAGFVSGHSTYSRTAAEVLTLLTGSKYFPGGIGEFQAPKDEFLVFEDGPSVDITLQWATYQDASDQCSLSRIWGGIHPPADDIPGRFIGMTLGPEAFNFAQGYFNANVLDTRGKRKETVKVSPNPVLPGNFVRFVMEKPLNRMDLSLYDLNGRQVYAETLETAKTGNSWQVPGIKAGVYLVKLVDPESKWSSEFKMLVK